MHKINDGHLYRSLCTLLIPEYLFFCKLISWSCTHVQLIVSVQSAAISVRGDRPDDWVPPEDVCVDYENFDDIETVPISADQKDSIEDVFSAHSYHNAGMTFPVSRIPFVNDTLAVHHRTQPSAVD